METGVVTVVVAVIGLLGVILVPLIAVLAGRGGTALKEQVELYTFVKAELKSARNDLDDSEARIVRLRTERDAAQDALGANLLRLGVVEAYARQLEVQYSLPHQHWTNAAITGVQA